MQSVVVDQPTYPIHRFDARLATRVSFRWVRDRLTIRGYQRPPPGPSTVL